MVHACTGHMLVSWLVSSFTSENNVCQRVSQRDMRLIAIQFCTYLLAANVIEKLEEVTNQSSGIFKVCSLSLHSYQRHSVDFNNNLIKFGCRDTVSQKKQDT